MYQSNGIYGLVWFAFQKKNEEKNHTTTHFNVSEHSKHLILFEME